MDNVPASNKDQNDVELGILDLFIVLLKYKWILVGLPVVGLLTAYISLLASPNLYTATARMLPPQQEAPAAAALLSQFGAALGGAFGSSKSSELYIGMLKSRSIADVLAERFNLRQAYGSDSLPGVRATLAKRTNISTGKDGIITIAVDDEEPKRAANLANAYIDGLTKLMSGLALTETSRRRLFFEQQLAEAKQNLAAAELIARQGLDKGGIAQVDTQGRAMLEVTAKLRAEISAKEVQIGAMRIYAGEHNPGLQKVQHELDALRRELRRVEGAGQESPIDSTTSRKSGLGNVALLRNVKYYEFLFETLARQYEIARLDEAREASLVQVLDHAVEPESYSKPNRGLIYILSVVGGFIVAIVLALFLEALSRARRNPANAGRFEDLKRYAAPKLSR